MKVLEPPMDEVMDYRGLSIYMKLAQGTLRHRVMRGEIPYFKIGRSVRFSRKQIDLWLADYHREPTRAQAKKGEGLLPTDGGLDD